MARALLLSNGELHVGLNEFAQVDDLYFPYVGQENHVAGKLHHRIGVWVDGMFSWLDDGNWRFSQKYHPQALIGRSAAHHDKLALTIEFDDCIDATQSALLRNIHIINHANETRDIRLFLHQVFNISSSYDSDTAQYVPAKSALLHYKGHRVFIASAIHADDGRPADGFSVGLFGIEGREGTYRDAEDGVLSGNAVEHGQVDSVLGVYCQIGAHDSHRIHYWIAAGSSQREAFKIHARLQKNGLLHYLLHTATHWKHWLEPTLHAASNMEPRLQERFIESVLLVKASQDKRGAVIASTDSSMLNYARDYYAYCWPRDGVYALWPLLRLGYKDELIRFFSYCRRSLHEDGYLNHKYQADGSLGSSWHSYIQPGGHSGPPIQEDETAAVLFLFGQYHARHQDEKLLADYYPTMIAPMANFMSGYLDHALGLPLPSYNLWEEVYQTNTYTVAVTYAALLEAAKLADAVGATDDAVRWRTCADDIQAKAQTALWNENKGFFYRGLLSHSDHVEYDEVIDVASFFGVFMFGLFDVDSSHMQTAFRTLETTLLPDQTIGLVRYEYDAYNRRHEASKGNPWPVTTLWLAQYLLEIGDHDRALKAIDWVLDRASPAGIIAEQYDPLSDEALSVAPLTWSQAELVSTLLDLTTAPIVAEEHHD